MLTPESTNGSTDADNPGLVAMQRLRDHRIRLRMSQAELAAAAGTTQSAISEAERGIVETKPSTIARLAAALGLRMIIDFVPLAAEPNADLTLVTYTGSVYCPPELTCNKIAVSPYPALPLDGIIPQPLAISHN